LPRGVRRGGPPQGAREAVLRGARSPGAQAADPHPAHGAARRARLSRPLARRPPSGIGAQRGRDSPDRQKGPVQVHRAFVASSGVRTLAVVGGVALAGTALAAALAHEVSPWVWGGAGSRRASLWSHIPQARPNGGLGMRNEPGRNRLKFQPLSPDEVKVSEQPLSVIPFLHALVGTNGSDLHCKVGSAPRVRVDGRLRKLQVPDLRPIDTENMLIEVLPEDLVDNYRRTHEADFAYSLKGVGRFRVNAYQARGTNALVFRRVAVGAQSLQELGLPEVVGELALEPRGLVLV